MGGALKSLYIDGVYFDCACISEPGVRNQSAMQMDAQVAFDKALGTAICNTNGTFLMEKTTLKGHYLGNSNRKLEMLMDIYIAYCSKLTSSEAVCRCW